MAASVMRRFVAGKMMHLEHSPGRMDFLDNFQAVGGKVWPASDLLVNYLSDTNIVLDKSVLELGSGCGYVGLACGILGARKVTLTDRVITQRRLEHDMEGMLIECEMEPDRMVLDICDRNILRNKELTGDTMLETKELEWGESNSAHIDNIVASGAYDIIIGSDVTYHANLSEDLFWTVSKLLRHHKDLSISNQSNGVVKNTQIAFLAAHQFRLDSATALTLSTAKRFGLQCTTLATSSSLQYIPPCPDLAIPPMKGDIEGAGGVRRYSNEVGVNGEFALWRFTLQSDRACGLKW